MLLGSTIDNQRKKSVVTTAFAIEWQRAKTCSLIGHERIIPEVRKSGVSQLLVGHSYLSFFLVHIEICSSTDSPRMDLARKRNKAIGAIADSSDREFSNSLPSNLFGQRKLKTPSTGKTDYLILVNVTSAEVTSISTIGRGLKVGKIGLSLELRTSSSLSERSVQ